MINKFRAYVGLTLAVQLASGCSREQASVADAQGRSTNESSSAPVAAPAAEEKQRLVLALGDSLYAGYGLEQGQSFPAVLERELADRGISAKIVNAGVSGDTTAGGLRRLAFTLDGLERKPDLALVGLGANDVLRGFDPGQTRSNLDAILAELKRRGIPIVITGMMAPRNLGSPYIRQFEAIYPELAEKYDAELDPFFLEGVITDRALLLGDGMHPNAEGVRRIARRLAPEIAEQLVGQD